MRPDEDVQLPEGSAWLTLSVRCQVGARPAAGNEFGPELLVFPVSYFLLKRSQRIV